MKLSEIQSHNISHRINVPFPVKWSEDDVIATATEKGVQILKTSAMRRKSDANNWCNNVVSMKMTRLLYMSMVILLVIIQPTLCSDDETFKVFGKATDGMPAAFGYFNTDTYTDLFVLTEDAQTVKILLGNEPSKEGEPLLREDDKLKCKFDKGIITSVVPGDFDGDAFLDVLVTVWRQGDEERPHVNDVYMLWGNGTSLDCKVKKPLFALYGQPLAVDWDQDMITDLFGIGGDSYNDQERGFWIFHENRTHTYKKMNIPKNRKSEPLKMPHSHAFVDLNYDSYGDLYLTLEDGSAEVWVYDKKEKDFRFEYVIERPPGVDNLKTNHHYMGQTLFQDVALDGNISQIIPVCFNDDCSNSTIYLSKFVRNVEINRRPEWHKLKVQNFKDWRFVRPNTPDADSRYLSTLTLRAGDFNMDGYPDLLVTLVANKQYRTSLLENIPCDPKSVDCSDKFPRTFIVRDTLSPSNNNTVLGVFYDFSQDGVLDVLLVHHKPHYKLSAFRNSLDYDANFIKVMVVSGNESSSSYHPFKSGKEIYGSNLPGPTVYYNMTTQEGDLRSAVLMQLPQSAHFALNLPYTISGLGRTPNYIEALKVGVYGEWRIWEQLIPNSQLVVTPRPRNDPSKWKVQLFVTPSRLIYQSFFALLGTCALISLIIGGLYWKERKEDHKEKLQEAQKFHFDAM